MRKPDERNISLECICMYVLYMSKNDMPKSTLQSNYNSNRFNNWQLEDINWNTLKGQRPEYDDAVVVQLSQARNIQCVLNEVKLLNK